MRTIEIKRFELDEKGCYGSLSTGDFDCYTLELPWRDNQPNISCIPVGIYHAFVDKNVTIGGKYVIRLKDVPNRKGILIHVFNYIEETAGCIGVGDDITSYEDKKMITNSRLTMQKLLNEIKDDEDFWVDITEA